MKIHSSHESQARMFVWIAIHARLVVSHQQAL
jgi:hypothetical protein